MESHRSRTSPFDSVLQYVPQGHEKHLKQAFYNTAATVFILLAGAALVAVYFILEAFLRPLLWALLCGSFLYPFKKSLTNLLRGWLDGLQTSGAPFLAGLFALPFQVVNNSSQFICNGIIGNIKLILGFFVSVFCLYILIEFGPIWKIYLVLKFFFYILYDIQGVFSSLWIWTLVIAYVLVVAFYWTEESKTLLRRLSVPVWILVVLHLSNIAGILRVPLLIFLAVVLVIGFITEGKKQDEQNNGDSASDDETKEAVKPVSDDSQQVDTIQQASSEKTKPSSLPIKSPAKPHEPNSDDKKSDTPKSDTQTDTNERSLSNTCFIALFWALILVRIWKNLWLLQLLPIPFAVVFGKSLVRLVWGSDTIQNVREKFKDWFKSRKEVLYPRSIRGLLKLVVEGDGKIINILKVSVDSATSTILILLLLSGTFSLTILSIVQTQQETMTLVNAVSNLFNTTLHPEITQYLPDSDYMQETMDTMIGNAYVHGREWIADKVHDLLDTEGVNNTHIEQQVLELWDTLYELWISKNTTSVSKPGLEIPDISNVTGIWTALSAGGGGFSTDAALAFVKENMGTFTTVLESVWMVLKGNINLVFSIITAVMNMLFGGGTAILNFIISTILFLTTLFYLLASSGNQYKPVELVTSFSPTGSGNKFGQAVEEAISGVFMASLKMTAFYGLYTWLIHSIFNVNIVFIPSALAAVFAAIPLVGTHLAAIPAMLELWLLHGEGAQAILLFVCQMLPQYVVDTAIYSEIKGGHPFLTGLAIVGGMSWMGLEGAIIGPIVLCCLIVLVNVYGTMLQPESPGPSVISSAFSVPKTTVA